MRAKRQHVGTVATQFDRLRHRNARGRTKGGAPSTIVITLSSARARIARFMADDEIGDALEFFPRLVIVDDQRLAARIGARRDERKVLRRIAPGAIFGLPAAA